jgi:hypothetical protein
MGVLRRASLPIPLLTALAVMWLLMVPAAARAAGASARPGSVLLVPPLEGADVTTVAVERDGTRRLISRGVRVLLTAQGELAVAEEALPADKSPVSVELPLRFGGGYLFAVSSAGRTALWKAGSWSGKLEPFADIDFEVARIIPGFDRIHLQARRGGEWAALDPDSGAGLQRGSLPPSPSFGAMAFVDSWFGAVELPVRGTVVSFDAGASWHPLGVDSTSLAVDGGSLVVGSERTAQLLGADGRFRPARARVEKREAREPLRVVREGGLGRLPLRTAVLRGVPDGDDAALVVSRGVLGRVRLRDGRVLAEAPRAVPATRECSGVRLGKGYGFICGELRGKTEIYAVRAPFGLALERQFDGPRVISPSDNGGLVVSGGCDSGALSDAAQHKRCIVAPQGGTFELQVAKSGLERVVALHDGRAVVLEPPSAERRGSLRLIEPSGSARTVPLSLDSDANATVLKAGFWLESLVESTPGVLSGWVVARGSFLGVRIDLDGKLKTGALQRSIENALISGRTAFVLGVSGIAEHSSDGGFNWDDAAIPAAVESDAERAQATSLETEQGCSLVGCVFRRWLRIGGRASVNALRSPPRAEPTVLPSPGGGRWQLECEFNGQVSPLSLPIVARRGYGSSEQVPSPWLPLLDVPAPVLGGDRAGIDVGTESELVQFRAYVFGPKAEFAKDSAFIVRVADRYRVKGVWSTAPAPSPWPDLEQAVDAFGYEGSGPAGWRVSLDPSGEAGVLSVNWRGTTDLYLLEHDRAVRRIANAPRYGLGVVSSAVRLGGTYYVATVVDARTLRVFALEPNAPRLVGEYRDVPFGGSSPLLVRSARDGTLAGGSNARRSALGLWARGTGWYVFPIDERTGAAAPAIEITPRALASVPRTCAEDEEGFLLEGPIGLEPLVEWSDSARSGRATARAVEGRFVVNGEDGTGEGSICVRALAAQADRPVRALPHTANAGDSGSAVARDGSARQLEDRLDQTRRSAGGKKEQTRARRGSAVPLVLSDRGERGRRYGFLCGPNG